MNLRFIFPKVEGTVWRRTIKRIKEDKLKLVVTSWAVFLFLPAMFSIMLFGAKQLSENNFNIVSTIFLINFIAFFIGMYFIFKTYHDIMSDYFKSFADLNFLEYKKTESNFTSNSRFVAKGYQLAGKSVYFNQHIFGDKDGIGIDFFEFMYSYRSILGGNDKHSITVKSHIISFDLHLPLPDIIISRGGDFKVESWQKKINLEGDFYKYYVVYVPVEHEIEALQILTPDVMQLCIDSEFRGSIELAGNKLILYEPKIPFEASDMERLILFGSKLTDIFYRQASIMRYVPYQSEEKLG